MKIIGSRLFAAGSVAAMLLLSGCQEGIIEESPKDVAYKSISYDLNTRGIISAETLTRWMQDWEHSKPISVPEGGRLIVLQAGPTTLGRGMGYLKGNGNDVIVYDIGAGGACDPSNKRFDGFSENYAAMLSGEDIDYRINAFQLDPQKDYLVFAVGKSSTSIREITRSFFALQYWGWDLERLAFLNGSVSYDFAPSSGLSSYLTAAPANAAGMPEQKREYHMYTMKKDRTSLIAYTKEMMQAVGKKKSFIVDARGTAEYDGTKKSKSVSKTCGPNHDQQCYTAYRGHIKGAVDLPYTDILVLDDQREDINGDGNIDEADASFKFKSPQELKELFKEKGYKKGQTVYAYCRTGRKATLVTMATMTALGYPTKLYDASWINWGSMAYVTDNTGASVFPQDSSWRTDVSKYVDLVGYNDPSEIESQSIFNFNFDATKTNAIKQADKEYLQQALAQQEQ